MWLVLCDANDAPAIWAHRGLVTRGLVPSELVLSRTLGTALRWKHTLDTTGSGVEIDLVDGRSIRSDDVKGVLNRLRFVPPEHMVFTRPDERDYVSQEMMAFYLSWLYALPGPVLNRPTPQGLSGQWRHISEWVWMASQAGLPVAPYRQSSDRHLLTQAWVERLVPPDTPVRTAFVVDGRVVGPDLPAYIEAGCRRVAEAADTGLIGIEFASGAVDEWTFAGATALPNLYLGGDALLDALAVALGGSKEARR
jgi:hypothetical protein